MRFTWVNTLLTLAPTLYLQPHPKCLSIKLPSMKGMPYLTLDSTVVFLPLLSLTYIRNPNILNLNPPSIASVHYIKAIYLDILVDPPTYFHL